MIELTLTIKQLEGDKLCVAMTDGDGEPTGEELALAYLLLMVVNEACEHSLENGIGLATEAPDIKKQIKEWQRHAR